MNAVVFPAEWHPQSAVMLTWPHDQGDWGATLAQVEPVFLAIARWVCHYQKLIVACLDDDQQTHVGQLLESAGISPSRFQLYVVPSEDSWSRDHGPIGVYLAGRLMLLDFTFNAWGDKFTAQLDNQITRRLHAAGAFADTLLQPIDFVLEGGSIDSDGAGTLLTTEACLLSKTRNPGYTRAEIEARLRDWLGIRQILWLRHGALEGDDTDSHIDTLARFCDPHTIAYVHCDDPNDSHYPALQAMAAELKQCRRLDGQPYRLVPLPWPRPKYDASGQRLPATYANFLIINGAVLVPTYHDPADAQALEILAACFPTREVIGIHSLPLTWQHGSLHCVTMQIPQPTDP